MSKISKKNAKPFLKWAGGKNQLLSEIEEYYIFDENITKYAEPFVGGGAVLFDILNRYTLDYIYISDINTDLINLYLCIRDKLEDLLYNLKSIEEQFLKLNMEERKKYYLSKREEFNKIKFNLKYKTIENAVLMIFLNKTCFNGLFRVNKSNKFNVPFGDYKNPKICDVDNLINVSKLLKKVDIVCGDYSRSYEFIDNHTFVYIDPPYRPLSVTSNFTSYNKNSFDDEEQKRLSEFVNRINNLGAKFLLSNSDPKNTDINDDFFDSLYSNFNIRRVLAKRNINSKGNLRNKITEILISNF